MHLQYQPLRHSCGLSKGRRILPCATGCRGGGYASERPGGYVNVGSAHGACAEDKFDDGSCLCERTNALTAARRPALMSKLRL